MKIKKSEYNKLLADIKERIRAAQYQALKAVNADLITLYWDIGKMIVSRQKKEGWGKSVVEKLSKDLQKDFPGISGLSPSGLWRMRTFYLTYYRDKNLAPLVREISWSHNIVVFEKCKDKLEREFYIRMSRKSGWTKNVLIHQIESGAYKRAMAGQTNFMKTLPKKQHPQAILAVKDEYTFDFLELGEQYNERELERSLLDKVEHFLREMGGLFAFIGSQYRLEVGGQEYFIDILLFHRRLRALVAVELKVGEFKPEFAGKMQFYLAALDDMVRMRYENPSIGIILCREKNRTIVEYALRNAKKPIGVAEYKIVKRLPKDMQRDLPSPEQIKNLLSEI